jgi:hypothetical protein
VGGFWQLWAREEMRNSNKKEYWGWGGELPWCKDQTTQFYNECPQIGISKP